MTQKPLQQFGGDWSAKKLESVRKYLIEYAKIMNSKQFHFAYVDAFAGTGYQTLKTENESNELMFPELADNDSKSFINGSARIALEIEPKFSRYIFIEKDEERYVELLKLKKEFAEVAERIQPINGDCNAFLQSFCLERNWKKYKKHRAVLFLDPFGMQVHWQTIKAIATTEAIDLWLLFPLGVAVNRLLKRDGQIDLKWRYRLDTMFGTSDWFDAFYEEKKIPTLFGVETKLEKRVNFEGIGNYFTSRLRTVFAGVAPNPLFLRNSRNNPLYLLCFAAGNPKGAPLAVKIASHILGM